MSVDFLMLWRWDTVQRELGSDDLRLRHAGSEQFDRLHVGDRLWIVTIPKEEGRSTGRLMLLGTLRAGRIARRAEAIKLFGITDIWEAELHVIAPEEAVETLRLLDITHLAPYLRFTSTHDRLTLSDGLVTGQQLQALRQLAPESAAAVEEFWREHADTQAAGGEELALDRAFLLKEDDGFPEGAAALRTHLVRERKRALVLLAKQHFKELHGRLFCQVCGFDFSEAYGELGADYIEAHHTLPVSQMSDGHVTRIDDLALVCANCHRMLHRRRPWLGMRDLRQILSTAHAG